MNNEAILNEAAASAIAAFTLSQMAFWAVYNSGLLSKTEAERMLREGAAANRSGGPANRGAAARLEAVLKAISASDEPKRQ